MPSIKWKCMQVCALCLKVAVVILAVAVAPVLTRHMSGPVFQIRVLGGGVYEPGPRFRDVWYPWMRQTVGDEIGLGVAECTVFASDMYAFDVQLGTINIDTGIGVEFGNLDDDGDLLCGVFRGVDDWAAFLQRMNRTIEACDFCTAAYRETGNYRGNDCRGRTGQFPGEAGYVELPNGQSCFKPQEQGGTCAADTSEAREWCRVLDQRWGETGILDAPYFSSGNPGYPWMYWQRNASTCPPDELDVRWTPWDPMTRIVETMVDPMCLEAGSVAEATVSPLMTISEEGEQDRITDYIVVAGDRVTDFKERRPVGCWSGTECKLTYAKSLGEVRVVVDQECNPNAGSGVDFRSHIVNFHPPWTGAHTEVRLDILALGGRGGGGSMVVMLCLYIFLLFFRVYVVGTEWRGRKLSDFDVRELPRWGCRWVLLKMCQLMGQLCLWLGTSVAPGLVLEPLFAFRFEQTLVEFYNKTHYINLAILIGAILTVFGLLVIADICRWCWCRRGGACVYWYDVFRGFLFTIIGLMGFIQLLIEAGANLEVNIAFAFRLLFNVDFSWSLSVMIFLIRFLQLTAMGVELGGSAISKAEICGCTRQAVKDRALAAARKRRGERCQGQQEAKEDAREAEEAAVVARMENVCREEHGGNGAPTGHWLPNAVTSGPPGGGCWLEEAEKTEEKAEKTGENNQKAEEKGEKKACTVDEAEQEEAIDI